MPTISRSTSLTWAHTPTKLHNKFGYQYSFSNKQYGEYDRNITLETSPYMILSIEISRYSLKLMRQRLTRSNNIAWNLMSKVRELAWCQIQPKHYHRHSDARLSQKWGSTEIEEENNNNLGISMLGISTKQKRSYLRINTKLLTEKLQ